MMNYYEPSLRADFFDPSYYDEPDHECEYSEEVAKFEAAKEFVEELIHHMYNTGSVEGMENALDELTGAWGISIPKSEPRIQKKQTQLFDYCVQLSKTFIDMTGGDDVLPGV
jgi:hypothetical protein